jgi:hypothetical protein
MNDQSPEQRLWQLWRQGQPPVLRDFLAQYPEASTTQIAAAIGVDQYERWQRGERPLAEEYLPLVPPGPEQSQAICDIIYGEYLMREQLGQHPQIGEFRERFPEHAESLNRQLEVHRALALTAARMAPPPPTTAPQIPGYELLGEIGRGGMGVVYRARQLSLDREVALKVLHVPDDDPSTLERMRREAQITARLSHPRIVSIFDAGRVGAYFFFAMELVIGEDLHRLVHRQGPLEPAAAEQYLREAADALSHAHAAGMVHRDIKPSNLMIGPAGLKLLDLGLARRAGAVGDSGLTQAGAFMGTPDYIAPEQANDARRADARSDLYSLGCTFFFALTGKTPFAGDTPLAKLMQHHAGQVPSPLVHRPELPPHLVAILARLMAKDPADRFPSADALIRALAPASASMPVRQRSQAELLHRFVVGDWVKGVAFSPDGRWLATVGMDRRLRIYNLFNGNLAWDALCPAGLLCVAFSPEGKSVVVGGEDRRVRLFDLATRAERWQMPGHADNINAVAFAARGVRLVTASHDGTLRVWETRTGEPRREWLAHQGPVWSVCTTPDGLFALSAGQDRLLRLWDVADGTLKDTWPELPAIPVSAAISTDGSRVLAGLGDGSVRVWSLRDRQPILHLAAHTWKVGAVCWAGGNAQFLTGGRDNLAHLWEIGSPTPVLKLQEHNRWVSCVAWCPGEPIFATGGADKQVCVWRLDA